MTLVKREDFCAKIEEALERFDFTGSLIDFAPYGGGHINDTFLVRYAQPDDSVKAYIVQRINHEIFKKPLEVMENIEGVTGFLRKKIQAEGGNPDRETLTVIPLRDGKNCFQDSIGSWWRAFYHIGDTLCLDQAETPEQFYQSAVAFGHFQKMLADYPAATLHETIEKFHDTPDRFRKFKEAVEKDIAGRAKSVQKEIAFVMEREAFTHTLMDLLKSGELPLRVTHNDTKLNNVMLDSKTGKPVCVIDLDTVMPGFSVNDFGDSIRFGASTGAEDEPDLSKVSFDINLYNIYLKGFLEGCDGRLTKKELEMLPVGAKMMTLECGMRFLTDYLEGDTYFRIHREGQNLDRCRTQFKLVADMESCWDEMGI